MSEVHQPTDALNCVLNGGSAPFVPVAPVYEGLGALEFHRMELWWRAWSKRLEAVGSDILPVSYRHYLDVELGIQQEVLDRWYPRPAWLGLPISRARDEVVGCAVGRHGDDLFWVSPDGESQWIPPDRVSYHAAQAADRTMRYAELWERGHGEERLAELEAEQSRDLGANFAPSDEQATSLAQSDRYEVARRLLERHPGEMPLYEYASSPYNSLLGLLGFQQMMTSLAERPTLVHAVLNRLLPQPSARLAAGRRLGVGIMFVEECLASADLISPRMYDEFVLPYTKETLRFYEDQGFRTVLYFSGNLMPLLTRLRKIPFTALSFEEDRKNYGIDLGEVRRAMGPDRILFGNVDAHFLEKASDEEVLAEVRRQIEVAGANGNFVLSVGSPFTPETKLERVRFFCESTRLT